MKKEIKEIIKKLKEYPNVMAIILFGSYAKGEEKPLSDIDIAVLIKNPDKLIEAEVASLSSNFLDVVNFHKLPLYIQFEVFKYGKPLYVRDKNFFTYLKWKTMRDYLEMSYIYKRLAEKILK